MKEIFELWSGSLLSGVCLGFMVGFICWGVGFGIYGIIKMFKMF